jgi:hypothetical protein
MIQPSSRFAKGPQRQCSNKIKQPKANRCWRVPDVVPVPPSLNAAKCDKSPRTKWRGPSSADGGPLFEAQLAAQG